MRQRCLGHALARPSGQMQMNAEPAPTHLEDLLKLSLSRGFSQTPYTFLAKATCIATSGSLLSGGPRANTVDVLLAGHALIGFRGLASLFGLRADTKL